MSEFLPIARQTVPEGVDVTHVARVVKANGTAFTSSDFSSPGTYDVEVYDDSGTQILNETGTSVSTGDPVFDSLQTDGYWDGKDDKGYNFRHTLTQSELSTDAFAGGKSYRTVYTLHSDSDGDIPLVFEDDVVSVYPA